MASSSGVNAPHEVSLLIDFRPVWDTDIWLRVGDIPLDDQRPNVCRPWLIPDVDSAERSACDASHHDCPFHHLWFCDVLDSSK